MIQPCIGTGICNKKHVVTRRDHPNGSSWIIFGCFGPGWLYFAIFDQHRAKVVGILYPICQQVFSHQSLGRGINGSVFFYCHHTITGHVISVDLTVFDAHAQWGRLPCLVAESTAVHTNDPAVR